MTSQELIDRLTQLQDKFGILPVKQFVLIDDRMTHQVEDFDVVYPSGTTQHPDHRPIYYVIQ